MSQGFSTSVDNTNPSMVSDTSGTVHGPYRGGFLSASLGGNRSNFNASTTTGVGSLAESTAGLDLNPVATDTSPLQPTPSSLPFHQPFIPPQVVIYPFGRREVC